MEAGACPALCQLIENTDESNRTTPTVQSFPPPDDLLPYAMSTGLTQYGKEDRGRSRQGSRYHLAGNLGHKYRGEVMFVLGLEDKKAAQAEEEQRPGCLERMHPRQETVRAQCGSRNSCS